MPIPVNLTENRNLDVCASLANYLWCNDPVFVSFLLVMA